jgi:hypothetical protein
VKITLETSLESLSTYHLCMRRERHLIKHGDLILHRYDLSPHEVFVYYYLVIGDVTLSNDYEDYIFTGVEFETRLENDIIQTSSYVPGEEPEYYMAASRWLKDWVVISSIGGK